MDAFGPPIPKTDKVISHGLPSRKINGPRLIKPLPGVIGSYGAADFPRNEPVEVPYDILREPLRPQQ